MLPNLGNIPNKELIRIFNHNIDTVQKLEQKQNFLLEVDRNNITLIEV